MCITHKFIYIITVINEMKDKKSRRIYYTYFLLNRFHRRVTISWHYFRNYIIYSFYIDLKVWRFKAREILLTSLGDGTVNINRKLWCRTRISNPSPNDFEVEVIAMNYQDSVSMLAGFLIPSLRVLI